MSFRAILISKTESGQSAALTTLEESDLMEGDVTIDVRVGRSPPLREAACHRACCHPTRLDRIAGRLGLNDCVGGTTR